MRILTMARGEGRVTTKFCMQCGKSKFITEESLLEWKAIYNKLGKVTRRICPECAAGRKKFDSSGVYKDQHGN